MLLHNELNCPADRLQGIYHCNGVTPFIDSYNTPAIPIKSGDETHPRAVYGLFLAAGFFRARWLSGTEQELSGEIAVATLSHECFISYNKKDFRRYGWMIYVSPKECIIMKITVARVVALLKTFDILGLIPKVRLAYRSSVGPFFAFFRIWIRRIIVRAIHTTTCIVTININIFKQLRMCGY